MAFEPITRLEKILTGEEATPYTRLEKAVQIAVDNAGSGGGDTYETVAEIAVGQMELADGKYMYTVPVATDLPDGDLYWDSANQPLTKYTDDDDMWAYNFDSDFNVLGTPAYAITVFSEEEESATIVVSDTNAIENTTIRILKKVSGGGSELPAVTSADNGKVLGVVNGTWDKTEASGGNDDFTVTATLGTDGDDITISDLSKSVGEIYTAYSAGKKVHLVMDGSALESGMDVDIPLTQIIGDDVATFGGNISGQRMATGLVLVMWDGDEAKISLYVPQEGSESNDFKVNISTDGQSITVADGVTVADIVAAANADKHVFVKATVAIGGITTYQRFELTTWVSGAGNNVVTFGAVQEDDGAAKAVALIGENTGGDDSWTVA